MMLYLVLIAINPIKTLNDLGFTYYKTQHNYICDRIAFIGDSVSVFEDSVCGYTYSRKNLYAGTLDEVVDFIIAENKNIDKIKDKEKKDKLNKKIKEKKPKKLKKIKEVSDDKTLE